MVAGYNSIFCRRPAVKAVTGLPFGVAAVSCAGIVWYRRAIHNTGVHIVCKIAIAAGLVNNGVGIAAVVYLHNKGAIAYDGLCNKGDGLAGALIGGLAGLAGKPGVGF